MMPFAQISSSVDILKRMEKTSRDIAAGARDIKDDIGKIRDLITGQIMILQDAQR